MYFCKNIEKWHDSMISLETCFQNETCFYKYVGVLNLFLSSSELSEGMASKVRIIKNLWFIIKFSSPLIFVSHSSIMIDLEHYWKIRGWSCYSWGWKLCEYIGEKRICKGWQLHPWILSRASRCSDTTCGRICPSRRRYHADFFLLLKRYWHPWRMQPNCKYSQGFNTFLPYPCISAER